jgi:tetratricopeptide (TPR) repeat protein
LNKSQFLFFIGIVWCSFSCTSKKTEGGTIPDSILYTNQSHSAIKILNRAILGTGANAENYYKRAQAYEQVAELGEAENDINRAIKLDPSNTELLWFKAQLLNQTKRYKEALELAQRTELLGFKEPKLYSLLTQISLNLNDLAHAQKYSQIAVKYAPYHGIYHYWHAISSLRSSDTATAIVSLEKAIALKPNHKESYASLSNVYSRLGEYQKAFYLAVQLEKQYPDYVANLLLLAQMYKAGENEPVALAYFERIFKLEPTNWQACLELGLNRLKNRQFQSAYSLFKTALNENPKISNIHTLVGMSAEFIGKKNEALEQYILAIHDDPLDRKALEGKSRIENIIYAPTGTIYSNDTKIEQ